jgi:uroporphyrinogen decarboxylase
MSDLNEMTYRERVLRAVQFEPADAVPFRHAYGLMPGVLEDWHAQGLPESVQTRDDIYAYFGFASKGKGLPLNVGFSPPFETALLEETPEYRIQMDHMGRKTKVLKEYASLPLAMDFPVKDMETWQDYKRRLTFSPERVGANLEAVVEENRSRGLLNNYGSMGFYWFPRDLMGDEQLCLAYYQMPELVEDICETWCSLIEQVLEAALQRVRLDGIHFGEDMAYHNGPMIGPEVFDRFVKPYYLRIQRLVERFDVPIFSVDSDGRTDILAEWLLPCGVNFIGPNEVRAGNDVVAYRKRFGEKLSYDGGLDKQVLLEGRDAVDAMLERVFPAMKASGGGWVAALDHRVVRGTTLADFEHYVRRCRELARY